MCQSLPWSLVRTGFPPKLVDPTSCSETSLKALGIRGGDTVIVAQSARKLLTATPPAAQAPDVGPALVSPVSTAPTLTLDPSRTALESFTSLLEGPRYVETNGNFLVLRVVPDDNSCLFTVVSLVVNPSSRPDPSALRRIVAESIRSDPLTYSEVLLGRPRQDYIATILSRNSWGGAIEISILSLHYRIEIWSIDVQTGRIDKFGEGLGYENCGFVVYSGIHYDALTLAFAQPPKRTNPFPPDLSFDSTLFPLPLDPATLAAAQQLVEQLRESHSYTDTATFTLRCEVCREAIQGEKEARQHASTTGHQRFGEYEG